ncbi:MAG: hypothetical protein NT120_02770 [Candidatus Aenigmarchaeota archaeon]|nr:hypothetical protein [Candidatus Aenigmarchaeota archaeon]
MANDKSKNKNIDGWFLFFIFTLVFVAPLYNIFVTDFSNYVAEDFIMFFGNIALFIASGIFLFNKRPYAVEFTKIVLISNFVLLLVVSALLSDYRGISTTVIYTIIWVTYLYKSKKVKRIYGKLKYRPKKYDVWNIMAIIYAFVIPYFGLVFSITSFYKRSKPLWLTALAIIIVFINFALAFSPIYENTSEISQNYQLPLNEPLVNTNVIDVCTAGSYLGDYKTVQGVVIDVFVSNTNTVFLNFGRPYPDHCFTAVIFASDKSKFGNVYSYKGKTVQVSGSVESYQGKSEIVLENPSQIKIV